MGDRAGLRVCYFGTYDPEYARTQYLLQGLRSNDVDVVECHESLWKGTADKIARASGGWKQLGFLLKLARAHMRLIKSYARLGPHDAVLVAYAGLLDIFPAWLVTRFSRRPLVLDALLSVYNSMVNERRLAGPHSVKARLVYGLERLGCQLADRVLLDTEAHIRYFCELYHLEADRFTCIPISADVRHFHPLPEDGNPKPERDRFHVVYHGKFIPNAGVDHILQAAALLADDPSIVFEFIGEGEGKDQAQALAQELRLRNVKFLGWMEKPELAHHLRHADVCLGALGDTPQARRAMSNKVLEGLAVGAAVLTADTPSNREIVQHEKTAYLCPPADPGRIAAGIHTLKRDPQLRWRIAAAGLALFQEQYTPRAVGRRLKAALESLSQP